MSSQKCHRPSPFRFARKVPGMQINGGETIVVDSKAHRVFYHQKMTVATLVVGPTGCYTVKRMDDHAHALLGTSENSHSH